MSQPNKKDALGKGIRSLLQNIDSDYRKYSRRPEPGSGGTGIIGQPRIPLEQIEVNPKQPRRDFDETALNELAASIRIHDIIQPLTVTRMPSGKFPPDRHERRFRASKLAGLKDAGLHPSGQRHRTARNFPARKPATERPQRHRGGPELQTPHGRTGIYPEQVAERMAKNEAPLPTTSAC